MCGISLVLSQKSCDEIHTTPLLTELGCLLRRRGPDYIGHAKVCAGQTALHITASLLQLRGSQASYAPLTAPSYQQEDNSSDAGSILAYNGEIFGGIPVLDGKNDGQQLFTALTGDRGVPAVLSSVRGPWSIIFWNATSHTLWFGRDPIGRRSLLLQWPTPERPCMVLTSVAVGLKQNASNTQPQPSSQHDTNSTTPNQTTQHSITNMADAGGTAPDNHSLGNSSSIQPASQVRPSEGPPIAAGNLNVFITQNDGDEEGGSSAVPHAATWQPWAHGSDWQEVPPGLYSLTLLPPSSPPPTLLQPASNQNTMLDSSSVDRLQGSSKGIPVSQAGSYAVSQQVGGDHVDQQRDDSGANHSDGMQQGVMNTCNQQHICNLGGEQWVFLHHPWIDDTANTLATYERPQHLITPSDDTGIPAPGSVPRSNVEALRRAMESQVTLQQTGGTTPLQQFSITDASLQGSGTNQLQSSPVISLSHPDGLDTRTGQAENSLPTDAINQHSPLSERTDTSKAGGDGNKRHGGKPRRNRTDAQQQQKTHSSNKHTSSASKGVARTPEYGVPESSVSTVLAALKEAVRIRCHCIEEHTAIQVQNPPRNSSVQHGQCQNSIVITDSSLQPSSCKHTSWTANSSIHQGTECIADNPTQPRNPGSDHTLTQPTHSSHDVASQSVNQQACKGIQCMQHVAPAPVLVLFSGGVDSTLIAALAHQCLPPDVPIDLSNVCFNNGKSPDRLAAINALHELKRYAPDRQWRLIMVNASLEEVDKHRDHLLQLLHPAGTVMDLNIGAALWLAVGARGRIYVPEETLSSTTTLLHTKSQSCTQNLDTSVPEATAAGERQRHNDSRDGKKVRNSDGDVDTSCVKEGVEYCSQARVVLLGHGADEQCAGYGRHRTKFALGGWQRLSDELALDVRRIWLRNLGRDDRLTADWGREARHPFLDENFMKTLLQDTALPDIADLYKAPGVGDKRVLRAALASLGLTGAAGRVKRAIQFGSHIGKLSNCREFGSNRQANKASAGTVALKKLEQKQRAL